MKILLVIDSFGSGGAQRQIVSLAVGLKAKGHEVEFFNYFPENDFFRQEVVEAGIKIHDCSKATRGFSFKVLISLRKLLLSGGYDIALAFLDTPSIYLLFAGIFGRTKIIVSDRSFYSGFNKYILALKRQFFNLADAVVTNSYSQGDWLIKRVRLPSRKIVTIYNGYLPELFPFNPLIPTESGRLKLIAIGRIAPAKNIENLIKGLGLFQSQFGWCPSITWVGRSESREYEKRIMDLLVANPQIEEKWRWAGQRNDIPDLLAEHHALILPSLFEGLPNVVCEAMFCGKPVLASDVCDNSKLVSGGDCGYLFAPTDAGSISRAIEKLARLDIAGWNGFAQNARDYAKKNLTLERMLNNYEELFERLCKT